MEVGFENGLTDGGLLLDHMSQIFGDWAGDRKGALRPAADVVEDREGYHFSLEIPGLEKDSLQVRIEDDALVIRAEREEPQWRKEASVHRRERRYGQIERAFRLPDDVARGAIKASYKDGVLDVSLPKLPEAKPVKIAVSYD